ncbi:ADP-ribose pyrophosphatase YjhB, NUDIX family [Actinokineospora alba]|uniref:ADP-ribose pyrophosphatase YjhB, NUDIX family n=1 Tax=Actinokineospora alba TaxID=504798 RepID=A0A1H0HFZ2_9PSEU|nr:NUDIX domain-containing protein [Actinokineospora alba]TDP64904.1 ADP-ribose pyrophosphatase YjhB (NUDIX family) [Actinokineospora alba]SDH48870.1 ADP-ribose pyrophosphatase YjhB, NUDIX family [Actinokineospora alba]SDO17954.1 ADP-ribose pyrophosphatase YjhB, NUDIX family [Actinokineospora alba]
MAVPVVTDRLAARVLCVDPDHRVLLVHWRDPVDGSLLWEPPGGRVEPGEDPAATASRELAEETGIVGARLVPTPVPVRRDYLWCGKRYQTLELFFVAFVDDPDRVQAPELSARESEILMERRWWHWTDLLATPERVEPPEIRAVLRALAPEGPWLTATPEPVVADR